MTKARLTYLFCFFSLSLFGQDLHDSIIKSFIDYYDDNSKYVFVETNIKNQKFQDTILLDFSGKDSLTIKVLGYNTVNWGTLFRVVSTDSLVAKQRADCWAQEFMTFVVYSNDKSDYLLDLYGCWSQAKVCLKR